MASQYLASELLVTALRDMGSLSSQDETATTERLLGFLNREQRVWLTKVMMSVREGYGKDVVSQTLAAGTTSFRVPTKAVGAKIDKLEVQTGDGWSELEQTRSHLVGADAANGNAAQWYFFDNSIYFVSALAASSVVRTTYVRRRNKIVDADETREISAINTGAQTVTLADTAPVDFLTTATSYDLIQGTPHFDLLSASASATRSSLTLTFADELPDDLAVGDYVALAGETPIAMVPVELQDLLCYRTIFCFLRAQGDPKAEQAKEDLEELKNDTLALLTPRAESHDEFLINYDAPGWNRRSIRRR